jgi:preprotein translocase subunit SecF
MNITKYKKISLTVSALLVIASIFAIATLGLNQGIDFTGGTLWQFRFVSAGDDQAGSIVSVSKELVSTTFVEDFGFINPIISEQEENEFLIRLPEMTEVDHQNFLNQLAEKVGEGVKVEELRFETIGPAISSELRSGSIKVFILVLIAISLYVIFAFRKISYRLASWRYGIITLLTLFHDAIIAIGFFAVLGYLTGAEVDVSMVVAILVIMGFSVHDTIVVFDRIRENLGGQKSESLGDIINKSVNDTLARSINTSLTLIFVLLTIYFLGAQSLEYFILTIIAGTIVGTYSSIFVASPLLTLGRKRSG